MGREQQIARVRIFGVDGKPLSPTTAARARKMVRDGVAAKGRDKNGFFITMLVTVGAAIPHQSVSARGSN